MLISKLKEIKYKYGYFFDEGNAYQQNLNDFKDDTSLSFDEKLKALLLYDFNETIEENDFGGLLKTKYDCLIFFAVRSIFTEPGGLNRTENYTELCRKEFNKVKNEFNICNAWDLKINKVNKKLNELDANLDGVMISCDIEYNHNYDSLV